MAKKLVPKPFLRKSIEAFSTIANEVFNTMISDLMKTEVFEATREVTTVVTKVPEKPEDMIYQILDVYEKKMVRKGGHPLLVILGIIAGVLLFPYISSAISGFVELMRKHSWYFARPEIYSKEEATQLLWRGKIDEEEWRKTFALHGYSEARINNLIELTRRLPTVSDLISFCVREVFDPERRKILLTIPTPQEFKDYMAMQGYDEFWSDSYWAAHWVLPPVTHLNAFLWRVKAGDISREDFNEDIWKMYMRYHDYEPIMIPLYEKIIFRPYTRVDTRRMYADGVLTREEVKKEYLRLGYDEEHAENLMLWTIAFEESRKIRDWLRKGWIDLEGAKQYMINLGIPKERVEEWVKRYVKNPERTAKERDLTKSEIVKGVKKGIITPEQALGLLMDIGYEEWEAKYIIAINLITMRGSPETYAEMLKATLMFKGPLPLELEKAIDELHELQLKIIKLEQYIEKMKKELRAIEEYSVELGELEALRYQEAQLLARIAELRKKYNI